MRLQIPPRRDRRFIAPERQRQKLRRLAEAHEGFDGDEAVDAVEQRTQLRRDVDIGLSPALRRPDLEDDRDQSVTCFRKLRSSFRMIFSRWANSKLATLLGSLRRQAR